MSVSDEWTGKTTFFLRMPIPESGKKWVHGRKVQIKRGTKTEHMPMFPELWREMSEVQRDREYRAWQIEGKKRAIARERLGIQEHIPA